MTLWGHFFKIKNEMAPFLGGFGCLGSQAAFSFFFKTETGNRLAGFIFKKIKIDGFLKSKTVARGRFLFTEKQMKRARDRGGRGGSGVAGCNVVCCAIPGHRHTPLRVVLLAFSRRSPDILSKMVRCVF